MTRERIVREIHAQNGCDERRTRRECVNINHTRHVPLHGMDDNVLVNGRRLYREIGILIDSPGPNVR